MKLNISRPFSLRPKILLVALIHIFSLDVKALASQEKNVLVIGAPGSGKTSLISSGLIDRNFFTNALSQVQGTSAFNAKQYSSLFDSVTLKLKPVIKCGSLFETQENQTMTQEKIPAKITSVGESCDFRTKEFNSYRNTNYSTTWIDSPGLNEKNARDIEAYIKASYLSSPIDHSNVFDKIVIVLEMDSRDVQLINEGAKVADQDGIVMKQLQLAKQVLESSIDLSSRKNPFVFVLTPSRSLLEDLEKQGLSSLNIPTESQVEKLLRRYVFTSIEKVGFDIDSRSIVGTLKSLAKIYEGHWDRNDTGELNLAADLINLDVVLSQIEKDNSSSQTGVKLHPSIEVKKNSVMKELRDRLEQLRSKSHYLYSLEEEHKASLVRFNGGLSQMSYDLNQIEKLDPAKSRSTIAVKQPALKSDKNRHSFKFTNEKESKNASYFTDRYFFGENDQSERGIFVSHGQQLRKLTSQAVSMPKKISVGDVHEQGEHTLFSTEFEFSNESNGQSGQKVRIEYIASGKDHEQFDLDGLIAKAIPFHERGVAKEIFFFGREFSVQGESKIDAKQIRVKRFTEEELELEDSQNKVAEIKSMLSQASFLADIESSYQEITEQYSRGNHELSAIKMEAVKLGFSDQEFLIERLLGKNEAGKVDLNLFADANYSETLRSLKEDQMNLRSMHKGVKNQVSTISEKSIEFMPENQSLHLSDWEYFDNADIDQSGWSISFLAEVTKITQAFELGVLRSFTDAKGTLVYRTNSANLISSLYSTLLVPRYQVESIAARTAYNLDFARENNFISDETDHNGSWHGEEYQSEKTKNLKLVVFGPRRSGKTTFLNTVNHFASTLDLAAADIRNANHHSNDMVPITAWLPEANHFPSWADDYYGNEMMSVGSLRAQLPAMDTSGCGYVTCVKPIEKQDDLMRTAQLFDQFSGGQGGTKQGGAMIDSLVSTKPSMIPQYRISMLDSAGTKKSAGIYDREEIFENSSYFFRAIKNRPEFSKFDGVVLVLSAKRIVEGSDAYMEEVRKEISLIDQIRKAEGKSQPLHIVFTHITAGLQSVGLQPQPAEQAKIADELRLRIYLTQFVSKNISGAGDSIYPYYLEHDPIWGNVQDADDAAVFRGYKMFAHEVGRLLGNISNNLWDWESYVCNEESSEPDAKLETRTCLDCVREQIESNRLFLSSSPLTDVKHPEVTEIRVKKGGFSQDFSIASQRLEGVSGYSQSLLSDQREPGFMQVLRISHGSDDHLKMEGLKTLPMHYFSPKDPKVDEPEVEFRQHWRDSKLRKAGAKKIVDDVVDGIVSLKDYPLDDKSEGAVDLFVVRSIGNVGKMRGQYFCKNIFFGYAGFDIMQPCQLGSLLQGISDRGESLTIGKDVDIAERIEISTKYAHDHCDWAGRDELSEEDLKLGRDLELMILIKRTVVHGQPKLEIVRLDLNSNHDDLRTASGFNDIDISSYLERTDWW